MLTTTAKGNIGLHNVIANLTKEEFEVFLPTEQHPHFDILVEVLPSIFKRMQVKYSEKKNGTINVRLYTQAGKKYNKHHKEDVDFFGIYEPVDNKVYYLDRKKFLNESMVKLRVAKPLSNIKKGVHWAKDFTSFAVVVQQ